MSIELVGLVWFGLSQLMSIAKKVLWPHVVVVHHNDAVHQVQSRAGALDQSSPQRAPTTNCQTVNLSAPSWPSLRHFTTHFGWGPWQLRKTGRRYFKSVPLCVPSVSACPMQQLSLNFKIFGSLKSANDFFLDGVPVNWCRCRSLDHLITC